MKFPIYLITCNRYEETKETVESFSKISGLTDHPLYLVDDASMQMGLVNICEDHGFKLLHRNQSQEGVISCLRTATKHASSIGAAWSMIIPNDWVWVRPFPMVVYDKAAADPTVWYLRLYGLYKERVDGQPRRMSIDHKRFGGRDTVVWEPYFDGWIKGDIHWSWIGMQRTQDCLWLVETARSVHHAGYISEEIKKSTIKPVDNIIWHIGYKRTPGFKK